MDTEVELTPEELAEIESPTEQSSEVVFAPEPTISPDIKALISAMHADTIAAVAEMKKPSQEEQERLDSLKAKRQHTQRQTRGALIEEERERRARQMMCSHSKPNGMTAFVAQINQDGCYRAWCHHCKYTSPPIRVAEWQKAEGLNFHKLRGITIPMLEKMAAESAPPTPRPVVPVGMEAVFD